MAKFRANMTRDVFCRLREKYPDNRTQLDEIVEYAGPKAIIYMDRLDGLPVRLTDELWRLALRINKKNFSSYYIQLREILELPKSKVESILEIGPGRGVFESLLINFSYRLTTIDVNPNNSPDIVCDILNNSIKDNSFDMAVCFQVLEHLPYKYFGQAMKTLSSIARNYVFISIPYQSNSLAVRVSSRFASRFLSRFSGAFNFFWPIRLPVKDIDEQKMLKRKDKHNPHYWEAGRKSFPVARILKDLESNGLTVLKRFHNPEFPYHYFILLAVS